MLTVSSISKSYGQQTVLNNISFTLNRGQRLGLVGPNGCGKTTLLRILIGDESPDAGSMRWTIPNIRPGYLPQGFHFFPDETINGYIERMQGNLPALENRLQELAAALGEHPALPNLHEEYDAVLEQLSTAAEGSGNAPSVLAALGLGKFSSQHPADRLSGGQKTRLMLAGALLANPHILLLDEPTNHLDISMLEWLEGWLLNFRGAVLIVSHDRMFLDHVVTGILELDENQHTLKEYDGNYSAFVETKQAEREHQQQAYVDQQEEIARLQSASRRVRSDAQFHRGGKTDDKDKFARGFFADRSLEKIRLAKQIEARIDRMLHEDRIDKPRNSWQMKLEFGDVPESGKNVILLEDLAIGYGNRVLLAGLQRRVRLGERLVIVGPNGCGKTTLLRTIAGLLPPLHGKVLLGSNVQPGFMAQEQENLPREGNPLTVILGVVSQSETDARAYLHKFLFAGDDVFTPIASLSYGERARLSLACLAAQGCNLLLLDEPLNHLDIPSRARFEQALLDFPGTVVVVTHDRYFIQSFASDVWELEQTKNRQIQ
jgi:ATP-binding cassette subfamily F protein 3